MSSPVLLKRTA